MCKIKEEHQKIPSLYLHYGGTVVLHAQGSILQYVLGCSKSNFHKEDFHFPDSHNVFWSTKYVAP